MNPDRTRKVDQLFEAALERAPQDRAAFLDQACGNDRELRREVEKMLNFDRQAEDFIQTDVLVARQLCAGLAAVHERGVLHRDLKPANIMLDEHGEVRITDFGIAALASELERREISGTPAYMSPEQLEGHELSAKSDIYSLGCSR